MIMLKANNVVFGTDFFSNGEVSYKPFKANSDRNDFELFFQSNKDITDLLFAVNYVKDIEPGSDLYLRMLYVPYGRMDRPIEGYIYSLKLFAQIINSCGFKAVYTLDNHSEGIVKLINNVIELDLNSYIEDVLDNYYKPDILFFPDKGAYNKYPKILNCCLDGRLRAIYGKKERVLDDSREIKYYEVFDDGIDLTNKKVLIIDDICCTGGTVMQAANVLLKKGVSDIRLWVAHLESNVIKYDIVRKGTPLSAIYTTDSIVRNYDESAFDDLKLFVLR